MDTDFEAWVRAEIGSEYVDAVTGDTSTYGTFTALYRFPAEDASLRAELADLLGDRLDAGELDDLLLELCSLQGPVGLLQLDDHGFVDAEFGDETTIVNRFAALERDYTEFCEAMDQEREATL